MFIFTYGIFYRSNSQNQNQTPMTSIREIISSYSFFFYSLIDLYYVLDLEEQHQKNPSTHKYVRPGAKLNLNGEVLLNQPVAYLD